MSSDAPTTNPFTPRFGMVPPHMAGRNDVIYSVTEALGGSLNSPELTSIFIGARGTGKTALLSYFGKLAEQLGWVTADVSAGPDMLEDIFERCSDACAHIVEPAPKRRLKQIQVAGVAGVAWDNTEGAGSWRTRMNAILDELGKNGVGLLITIDEVDPRLDEMNRLAMTYQHFVREGRKVALLMAGLPSNVADLITGKRTSFLRRASQFDLTSIADYEIEEAFELTVEEGGKTISAPALERASEAIGGFPYMFQLVGFRAWKASANRDSIQLDDVERGVNIATKELRSKVFDSTYAELSHADRDFLEAMLLDEGPTLQSELPARLGKTSSHVSNYKKRLMRHGIIEEFPKGTIRFCLPGFRDYLITR